MKILKCEIVAVLAVSATAFGALEDDVPYLRGKWRGNVTDEGAGLGTDPERYGNLQVRVCGRNVRWNDLPSEQQDAYIRRAECVAGNIK